MPGIDQSLIFMFAATILIIVIIVPFLIMRSNSVEHRRKRIILYPDLNNYKINKKLSLIPYILIILYGVIILFSTKIIGFLVERYNFPLMAGITLFGAFICLSLILTYSMFNYQDIAKYLHEKRNKIKSNFSGNPISEVESTENPELKSIELERDSMLEKIYSNNPKKSLNLITKNQLLESRMRNEFLQNQPANSEDLRYSHKISKDIRIKDSISKNLNEDKDFQLLKENSLSSRLKKLKNKFEIENEAQEESKKILAIDLGSIASLAGNAISSIGSGNDVSTEILKTVGTEGLEYIKDKQKKKQGIKSKRKSFIQRKKELYKNAIKLPKNFRLLSILPLIIGVLLGVFSIIASNHIEIFDFLFRCNVFGDKTTDFSILDIRATQSYMFGIEMIVISTILFIIDEIFVNTKIKIRRVNRTTLINYSFFAFLLGYFIEMLINLKNNSDSLILINTKLVFSFICFIYLAKAIMIKDFKYNSEKPVKCNKIEIMFQINLIRGILYFLLLFLIVNETHIYEICMEFPEILELSCSQRFGYIMKYTKNVCDIFEMYLSWFMVMEILITIFITIPIIRELKQYYKNQELENKSNTDKLDKKFNFGWGILKTVVGMTGPQSKIIMYIVIAVLILISTLMFGEGIFIIILLVWIKFPKLLQKRIDKNYKKNLKKYSTLNNKKKNSKQSSKKKKALAVLNSSFEENQKLNQISSNKIKNHKPSLSMEETYFIPSALMVTIFGGTYFHKCTDFYENLSNEEEKSKINEETLQIAKNLLAGIEDGNKKSKKSLKQLLKLNQSKKVKNTSINSSSNENEDNNKDNENEIADDQVLTVSNKVKNSFLSMEEKIRYYPFKKLTITASIVIGLAILYLFALTFTSIHPDSTKWFHPSVIIVIFGVIGIISDKKQLYGILEAGIIPAAIMAVVDGLVLDYLSMGLNIGVVLLGIAFLIKKSAIEWDMALICAGIYKYIYLIAEFVFQDSSQTRYYENLDIIYYLILWFSPFLIAIYMAVNKPTKMSIKKRNAESKIYSSKLEEKLYQKLGNSAIANNFDIILFLILGFAFGSIDMAISNDIMAYLNLSVWSFSAAVLTFLFSSVFYSYIVLVASPISLFLLMINPSPSLIYSFYHIVVIIAVLNVIYNQKEIEYKRVLVWSLVLSFLILATMNEVLSLSISILTILILSLVNTCAVTILASFIDKERQKNLNDMFDRTKMKEKGFTEIIASLDGNFIDLEEESTILMQDVRRYYEYFNKLSETNSESLDSYMINILNWMKGKKIYLSKGTLNWLKKHNLYQKIIKIHLTEVDLRTISVNQINPEIFLRIYNNFLNTPELLYAAKSISMASSVGCKYITLPDIEWLFLEDYISEGKKTDVIYDFKFFILPFNIPKIDYNKQYLAENSANEIQRIHKMFKKLKETEEFQDILVSNNKIYKDVTQLSKYCKEDIKDVEIDPVKNIIRKYIENGIRNSSVFFKLSLVIITFISLSYLLFLLLPTGIDSFLNNFYEFGATAIWIDVIISILIIMLSFSVARYFLNQIKYQKLAIIENKLNETKMDNIDTLSTPSISQK